MPGCVCHNCELWCNITHQFKTTLWIPNFRSLDPAASRMFCHFTFPGLLIWNQSQPNKKDDVLKGQTLVQNVGVKNYETFNFSLSASNCWSQAGPPVHHSLFLPKHIVTRGNRLERLSIQQVWQQPEALQEVKLLLWWPKLFGPNEAGLCSLKLFNSMVLWLATRFFSQFHNNFWIANRIISWNCKFMQI